MGESIGVGIGGDSVVCNIDMHRKYMETVVGDILYNKMKVALSFFILCSFLIFVLVGS